MTLDPQWTRHHSQVFRVLQQSQVAQDAQQILACQVLQLGQGDRANIR